MNTENKNESYDDLRDEYDFPNMPGGIHGKYAKDYQKGVKLIQLEPDVAKMFPDTKSVNEALRALSKIIQQHNKTA